MGPKYANSTFESTERGTGIHLDFLAKKRLECIIMATYIKPKGFKKTKRKKRRASAKPFDFDHQLPTSIAPKWGYSKSQNMGTSRISKMGNPAPIPSDVAMIYPQDNLLWSYFKNRAKIIDQNAWLPIVSLWRQNKSNIIYMLRGSNKKKSISNKRRKKKKGRSM